MSECRFCCAQLRGAQALGAHLRDCLYYQTHRLEREAGPTTLTARRRVPGYPEAERCPGAPSPAAFAKAMGRWWALPPR